jgi:carbamoyltransferase
LREGRVSPDEITAILVATRDATYTEGVGARARPPFLYRVGTAIPSPPPVGRKIRASFADARRRRIDEALRSEFGFSCPVFFLDHHLVHAVQAAYATGRPDCLAITMDDGAEGFWSTVTSFRDGRPQRIAAERTPGSVLHFLEEVCDRLGVPQGLDRYHRLDELGSRGEPIYHERLLPLFLTAKGRIKYREELTRRSGGPLGGLPGKSRKIDLAASALQVAGEIVSRHVAYWRVRTEHDTVVLGGDLFSIDPIVQAVLEEVPKALVAPAPGDDGLAVGAALAACLPDYLPDPPPVPRTTLPSPFLGISFDDDAILEALLLEGLRPNPREEIHSDVADLLARGRTVARFAGRTEIGNRGLGNRAVLQNPQGTLRRGRAGFVLLPSSYHALVSTDAFPDLFECEGPCAEDLISAPMPVRPLSHFALRCPELVAGSGHVKVQTIRPGSNPGLFGILKDFDSKVGFPCLAVAPFRLPDEPLVSSPREALSTFRLLGADVAAFGRFLLSAADILAAHMGTPSRAG